jgi:hypothetical protein
VTSRSPEAGPFQGSIGRKPRAVPSSRAILRSAIAALGLGATLGGCIDPKADYDDFVARPVLVPEAGMPDVVLTPCEELLQQDVSGSYFLSCLPQNPPLPFSLAAQLQVTAADGGSPMVAVSFRPLRDMAVNLADGVGDEVVLAPTPIASDCTFVQQIGNFTLPPSANSLDLNIVASDVVLRGKLQSTTNSCGDLDGTVITPPIGIMLAGNGDACVFIRTPMDAPVPVLSASDYVCDPAQLPPPM